MPKKAFQKPFRTGDVVAIKPNRKHVVWKAGDIHIIHYYDISSGYCTNKGAWFSHEDFSLVRECDEHSMAQLKKDRAAEEEAGYEEC